MEYSGIPNFGVSRAAHMMGFNPAVNARRNVAPLLRLGWQPSLVGVSADKMNREYVDFRLL
jgi:hypothetical protein